MSCNCPTPSPVSPSGDALPSIGDLSQACADTPSCGDAGCPVPVSSVEGSTVCVDGNALKSSASPGTKLAGSYTDPIYDYNEQGITILGRIGQQLAAFCGSGFLQLKDGKATVVQKLQLTVSTLWHQWWKPTGINKTPVLGDPLPAPFQVVADDCGNLHAIRGVEGSDAIQMWNGTTETWDVVNAADFPKCQAGKLPKLNSLEVTGYAPIGLTDDPLTERCLSTLAGAGILVGYQQPTTPDKDGCGDDVAANASIVGFLPYPTVNSTLKWSTTEGIHFEADV